MRIVHIIGSLDPAVGGPPRVAACLAAAQAALGHDVRILTTVNPDRQRQVDEMTQLMPGWSKVEVLHSPGPSLVQSLAAWPVPPVMHEAMRWAQVAHLHSFWGSSLRLAVKAARRQRTPYLLTPHGTLDPWSLAQKKLKKRIAMAMGFRKLLDHAAMVHALNEDERRLIDPLKLKCPIMVIPNGVFLEEIDPLPSAEGFASGRPGLKGKNYMLFLSRLHYKKGEPVLADAYSKFVRQGGGLDLVVAGPDAGARADFEQRVRHHGVTDGVHIVGPLYGQDKIAAMSGATVFVLPLDRRASAS